MEGESNKARAAFEDYFALGPGRSLTKLLAIYKKRPKPAPPTNQLTTLKQWSTGFKWQERIAEREQAIAQEQVEGMKKAARETGYAVIEQRLRDLNSLAELLNSEIYEEDKRWLPDVKQAGNERVDIVRFNAPLIQQFRETLNDIASELGQRVKGLELSGKGGGPLTTIDLTRLSDEQLQRIANGENPASVVASTPGNGRDGTAAARADDPGDRASDGSGSEVDTDNGSATAGD
jgi:hypothetical protein